VDIIEIKRMHDLIALAGISRLTLSTSERSEVQNKSTSMSFFPTDTQDLSFSVFHSDTHRALTIMQPRKIASTILETRQLLLGGSIGKEWQTLDKQQCVNLGLIYDPQDPVVTRVSGFAHGEIIEGLLEIIGKYHHEAFASMQVESGTAIFCKTSVLKKIQALENVPDISIGSGFGMVM
jgi:hypothetical protein